MDKLASTLNHFESKFAYDDDNDDNDGVDRCDSAEETNIKTATRAASGSSEDDGARSPTTPERELQQIFSSSPSSIEDEGDDDGEVESRKKVSPRKIQLIANMRSQQAKIRANKQLVQQQQLDGQMKQHKKLIKRRLQPPELAPVVNGDVNDYKNLRISPEGKTVFFIKSTSA